MGLNDELLDINKRISYYTSDTYNYIPYSSGVYAWFYPLRIKTDDLNKYFEQVSAVMNFNKRKPFCGSYDENFSIGWRNFYIKSELKKTSSQEKLSNEWFELFNKAKESGDKTKIDKIKRIIFSASIFMPPLYIGKASNLNHRAFEHINGNSERNKNTFHNRFERFALLKNLDHKHVKDLIFACIENEHLANDKREEGFIEQILMSFMRPPFSDK